MRILFNHGLTAGELYTNTPDSTFNRKWRWMIKRYGSSSSYEDAIADPFKYCFGLILHKVISERVRFRIPAVSEAYIDFEIVNGDKFIEQRQNGRFSEIDFINSDFTGYFLTYYFKSKAYQKEVPIYIGGELKSKFIDAINSGVKFYTTKDFTLSDIIDEVALKFNDISKTELKKLLTHGFRRMHSCIKFGCAISISTRKFINCLAYIGKLSLSPEKNMKEYSIRRDRKLRKIEAWKKLPFDGYYYIGLNPTAFEKWLELNKGARVISKFTNVIPRKIQGELYYKAKHLHIFRFKLPEFKGWAFWVDELRIRNVDYLGEAYEHKFTPYNKTWTELRKEYEKRSD